MSSHNVPYPFIATTVKVRRAGRRGKAREALVNRPHGHEMNPAEDTNIKDQARICRLNGGACNRIIYVGDAARHIAAEHGSDLRAEAHAHPEGKVRCQWPGCFEELSLDSYNKHVQTIHFEDRITCIRCGNSERQDSYLKFHGLAKNCTKRNLVASSSLPGGSPDARAPQPSPSTSTTTTPAQSPPSSTPSRLRASHRLHPYAGVGWDSTQVALPSTPNHGRARRGGRRAHAREPATAGGPSMAGFPTPELQVPATTQYSNLPSPFDDILQRLLFAPVVESTALSLPMPPPAPQLVSTHMEESWPIFPPSLPAWQVPVPAAATDESLLGTPSLDDMGCLTTESLPHESCPEEAFAVPLDTQATGATEDALWSELFSLDAASESPAATADEIDFSPFFQGSEPSQASPAPSDVQATEDILSLDDLFGTASPTAAAGEIDFSTLGEYDDLFM